jgi:hypothetical protein
MLSTFVLCNAQIVYAMSWAEEIEEFGFSRGTPKSEFLNVFLICCYQALNVKYNRNSIRGSGRTREKHRISFCVVKKQTYCTYVKRKLIHFNL